MDEDSEEEDLVSNNNYVIQGNVSKVAGANEPAYYSRVGSSRTKSKTKASCSSSSSTQLLPQPTPTPINLDAYETDEEDIDGYKSNDGENEDEDLSSENDFNLQDFRINFVIVFVLFYLTC